MYRQSLQPHLERLNRVVHDVVNSSGVHLGTPAIHPGCLQV
jgi:hypothetical protein